MVLVYNKEIALKTLAEKLYGLNWVVVAGMATEIYTNGRRTARDIDIVVWKDDFNEAARRLGGEIGSLTTEIKGFVVFWDKYTKGKIDGIDFEMVCNDARFKIMGTPRRMELTEEHLSHVKKIEYLGTEMNVAPIEWVLAQKGLMGREKDMNDIALLMDNYEPNIELLNLFLDMYNLKDEEKEKTLSKIL